MRELVSIEPLTPSPVVSPPAERPVPFFTIQKRANDPGDIFVLDGYSFGEDYQKQIKAMGLPLVCIDDLYPLSSYS